MDDEAPKTIKLRAEDNAWFLLATLYGRPAPDDRELQSKNCQAWNRYMANAISRDSRQKLVGGGKYSAEELNPSPASEIELFFWKRHKQAGSAASTALPKVEPWRAIDFSIDFSNLEFDEPLYLDRFFFPSLITFERASFSRSADFRNTAFAGPDYFKDVDFSDPAHFERAALFDFTFYGATANFERATFSDSATFGGANFSGGANFEGATFSEHADFNGANFSGGANFDGTTFSEATFGGANFSGRANFDGAKFSGDANFERASFLSSEEIPSRWPLIAMTATFHHATFSERAYFNGATFSGAIFEEAIFFKEADFSYATFSTEADFASATFSGDVEFHATTFGRLTRFDFATIKSMMAFVNASMKGPTSFEWAEFRGEPPRFFGAQLHEGTVWRSVSWPIPRSRDEAGKYVDAYERLKLEMDRLKKHEDELDFFALELQSRRVLGVGTPIVIYGLLCDYGRSYFLPLGWLFVTIVVGAALFLTHFGLSKYPQAIGLSLANTFGVLGFRKDFIDPNTIEFLSRILKVVSAAQTIAGIVLLFCFGLAVRNRFRMK
jgi:uncharacterized protein YjbI with pentapeptide repeats